MHTHFARLRTLGIMLGLAALTGLSLRAFLLLLSRLAYELQGPVTWDTALYWAVGRGIVEGMLPYTDLFETKPPGIFLLSALSILLTGTPYLTHILQAAAIALFPVLLLLYATSITRHCDPRRRLVITVGSVLFGIVLALYTAERSGEVQVESFGSAAAGIFLLLVSTNAHPPRSRRWWAALALGAAVGLKEPFVLSAVGGALLLHRDSWRRIRSHVLDPLFRAALLGITALFALGYVRGYVSVYLPEMLGKHIHASGPLWKRAIAVQRLWEDLQWYSPVLLWTMVTAFSVLALAALFRKHRLGILAVLGFAILCASTSVGMGGQYFNHHFAFAVPVYMGAGMAFLATCATARLRIPALAGAYATTVAMLLTVLRLPQPAYAERIRDSNVWKNRAVVSAAYIDATLDACGEERYLFLGINGAQPFGFTRHVPLGPLFFQYDYLLSGDREHFRTALLRSLAAADLVIVDDPQLHELQETVHAYLDKNFSTQPWPCAGAAPDDGYAYLFRTYGTVQE